MYVLIYLLFAHWVFDFVMQKNEWAQNKSKSVVALSKHVATYTAGMTLATWVLGNPLPGLLIGLLHFPVDFVTSKITSRLYKQDKIHSFFTVIGFDQWIHMSTIMWLGWELV